MSLVVKHQNTHVSPVAEDDSPQAIADAARHCWTSFEEGLENFLDSDYSIQKKGHAKLDFQSDFEQFQLWTGNIGVFASDNASLDYRLREAPAVKNNICKLLESLQKLISKLVELMPLVSQVDHETLDEDSLSSADTSSSSEHEPGPVYQFRCLLEDVNDLVNKLLSIAAAIRKSGLKARNLRADTWQPPSEGGIDEIQIFREQFSVILEMRYGLKNEDHKYLRARICDAIARQRQRLLFRKAHQTKLMAYGASVLSHAPPKVMPVPVNKNALQLTATSPTQVPKPTASKISKGTLFTEATTFELQSIRTQSSFQSVSRSTVSSSVNPTKRVFPRPPAIDGRTSHFQCPYCCILVSRDKAASRSQWESHVLSDLCPFVCVAPHCDENVQQFERESEWYEHHRHCHGMQWWCDGTDPPHDPQCFHDSNAFENHIIQDHQTPYSKVQLASLIKYSSIASEHPFHACLFCDIGEAEEGVNFDWRKHITGHLIDLFITFAIPLDDNVQDAEEVESNQTVQRSTLNSSEAGDLPVPDDFESDTVDTGLDPPFEQREHFEDQWVFVPITKWTGVDVVLEHLAEAAQSGPHALSDELQLSTERQKQTPKRKSAIAFSPDGKLLVSASHGETISVFQVSTGRLLRRLVGHTATVTSLAFHPNGLMLASASEDQTVRIWSSTTYEEASKPVLHSSAVTSVAFSPLGRLLASGSDDGTIHMWDNVTGEQYRPLEGHTDSITRVAFSPDGGQLVSASHDTTIRLWDVNTALETSKDVIDDRQMTAEEFFSSRAFF